VKINLIKAVKAENDRNVKNIICDTIGDLAGTIFSEED
jgi:hypothetical protein